MIRVLMLSSEYPPASVGGLGRAVCDLSRALVRQGVGVHVATANHDGLPEYEEYQGVHVHRSGNYHYRGELLTENIAFNINLTNTVVGILEQYRMDVVHAHDWLTTGAAKAVKVFSGLPLVATVHATEHGRNNGIHNPQQEKIHSLEWELTYQAGAVITCSSYMAGEVAWLFSLPRDKVHVIPNGVDPQEIKASEPLEGIRGKYALPWEKIVFFVGRQVWEKGVDTLLQAAPMVLQRCPEAKFVIAGTGPMAQDFRDTANRLGLGEKAYFTGFMEDGERNALFRTCSTAVFPSLYEPFGIVALEAMGSGAPLVVSDTGGLGDLVEHGVDGLKAYPGNADSLAHGIIGLLTDSVGARAMAERAKEKAIRDYGWDGIAHRTLDLYRGLIGPTTE